MKVYYSETVKLSTRRRNTYYKDNIHELLVFLSKDNTTSRNKISKRREKIILREVNTDTRIFSFDI